MLLKMWLDPGAPPQLAGLHIPPIGVPEGYVTIIQDMYNDCETLVSTRTGDTEYLNSCRSRIAPRVCIKSTSLYTNHGCSTGRDRKGATMGDVVCG